MSYEGYEVSLCKRGHKVLHDAYGDSLSGCPFCGSDLKFLFAVDQTNGPDETGRCPGEENFQFLVVDTPEVKETCGCCGAMKLVQRETFKWTKPTS